MKLWSDRLHLIPAEVGQSFPIHFRITHVVIRGVCDLANKAVKKLH